MNVSLTSPHARYDLSSTSIFYIVKIRSLHHDEYICFRKHWQKNSTQWVHESKIMRHGLFVRLKYVEVDSVFTA